MENDKIETFLDKHWTPEDEKTFWEDEKTFLERMKICKGKRKDGKDGKCTNVYNHNGGCWTCPIENGLYEPEELRNDN
jgi:hypothetical protein